MFNNSKKNTIMKKMIFSLLAMLTIAVSASAMSYEQARNEALFLTDKMAYELNLTDAQYEAAYEINLDYLMGVTSQYDVFGPYWERRNLDLSFILFSWQWDLYRAATYFYRPLFFDAGYWHFGIYARYPHRDYFYFGRPTFYVTYRGGHSWRMNGGRSYYEGRRDYYRPAHHTRDQHFGMRNGWDRGDYRGGNMNSRPSSTHVTGGNSFNEPGNGRTLHVGGSRNGGQQGGFGSGRFGGNDRQGNGVGDRQVNGGLGSRQQTLPSNGTQSRGTLGGDQPRQGVTNSNGNFGGSRTGGSQTPTVTRPTVTTPQGSRSTVTSPQVSRPSVSTSRTTGTFAGSRSNTVGATVNRSAGSLSTGASTTRSNVSSGRSGGSVSSGRSGGSNSHGSFGGGRR